MRRVLVFDVDGVVVDPGPGRGRLVEELSGCDEAELAMLRRFRVFEHDAALAELALAWREAGRPLVHEGVLERLQPARSLGQALARRYREDRAWQREPLLLPAGLLVGLEADFELAVVTGRSRWELDRVEERLELRFSRASTGDRLPRTDPEALLSVLPPGTEQAVVVGTGPAQRRLVEAARFFTRVPLLYAEPESPERLLVELRLAPDAAEAAVQTLG